MTPGTATQLHLKYFFKVIISLVALLASACASGPARQPNVSNVQNAVPVNPALAHSDRRQSAHTGLAIASRMLGEPYHYGGASPGGFDCSGLVYYAYRKAGLAVPRTASAQFRAARPVERSRLQPGDLLFFRLTSRPVSHVGIYAGDGRFIHAPSRGKRVSYASMDNPYWQRRIVAAGRY